MVKLINLTLTPEQLRVVMTAVHVANGMLSRSIDEVLDHAAIYAACVQIAGIEQHAALLDNIVKLDKATSSEAH